MTYRLSVDLNIKRPEETHKKNPFLFSLYLTSFYCPGERNSKMSGGVCLHYKGKFSFTNRKSGEEWFRLITFPQKYVRFLGV